jgi:hypothetical protein
MLSSSFGQGQQQRRKYGQNSGDEKHRVYHSLFSPTYYLPSSRLLVRNTNSGGGINIILRKIIELLNTNKGANM